MAKLLKWLGLWLILFSTSASIAGSNAMGGSQIDKNAILELLSIYIDQPVRAAKIYNIITNPKYSAVVDCEELVGTRTAYGGVWVDYIPEKADVYYTTPMIRLIYINLDRGLSVLHTPKGACSVRNPALPAVGP